MSKSYQHQHRSGEHKPVVPKLVAPKLNLSKLFTSSKPSSRLPLVHSYAKFLALIAILLPSYFLIPPSATSAIGGSSQVSVSISDIITIRVMNADASSAIENLSLDLLPTPQGTFTKGSMNVEVSTSNTAGYKLYISSLGKDHEENYTNALINADSSVPASSGTVPTLSASNVTEAAFSQPNSSYKNSWGYSTNSLIAINSGTAEQPSYSFSSNANTSSITYNPVPVNGNDVVIREDTATAVDQELTPVTVGVNASAAIASGVYNNTLEFTAIANPTPVDFAVEFNANTDRNGGNDGTVANLPDKATASAVASSYTITLPDTIPTRSGYAFVGWGTKPDGSGETYPAGSSFTMIVDDADPYSVKATLYALWTTGNIKFYTISTMQEMTNAICNTATTPSSTATAKDTTGYYAGNTAYVPERTLTDTRDNNTYTIRKLADGNCWMTENLKLKLETGKEVIASTNTGNTFSYTPQGTGGNNATEAMNSNTKTPADNGNYYYSWYAATAGTGISLASQRSEDAVGSICPKGWRLPSNYSINAAKSYGSLTNAYGITTDGKTISGDYTSILENFPLGFVRLGLYENGNLTNMSTGFYWSSTASYNINAYYLSYNSLTANPQYDWRRHLGISLRCVNTSENIETPTFYNISTMQEMDSTVCGTATTPAASATDSSKVDSTGPYKGNTSYVPEKTLVDARDGNTYTVRKLADGNCWTTENLKLSLEVGKPVTISSATSSETKTWTPEANPDPSNANNNVPMNGNTVYDSGKKLWYYSWYAATGSSGTYSMVKDEDASYSICPANWRLPANYSVSTTKSYKTLMDVYGITGSNALSVESFPLDFVRSGRYGSGSLGATTNGYYWSSTTASVSSTRYLNYSSSYLGLQDGGSRSIGYSLRCLAQ